MPLEENYLQVAYPIYCSGDRHLWEPSVGDPVPKSAWGGRACRCGKARLVLKRCDLGEEHLVVAPSC